MCTCEQAYPQLTDEVVAKQAQAFDRMAARMKKDRKPSA